MAAVRHLRTVKLKLLTAMHIRDTFPCTVPNLAEIGHTAFAETSRFFVFF